MKIQIVGRHMEITEAIRDHVEKKLQFLLEEKTFSVISVNVTLEVEKSRCNVEMFVTVSGGHELASHFVDYDMYKAIDEAADKIDAQLKKLVDKSKDYKRTTLKDIEEKSAQEK